MTHYDAALFHSLRLDSYGWLFQIVLLIWFSRLLQVNMRRPFDQ